MPKNEHRHYVDSMLIEINSIFYKIIITDKTDIQIDSTLDPIHVYAPAYLHTATLKQYLLSLTEYSKKRENNFTYLNHPYELFGKSYLVRIYPYSGTPYVVLDRNRIHVHQRYSSPTVKILENWTRDHLRSTINGLLAYWEEQLGILVEVRYSISIGMHKSLFRIVRNQEHIRFSIQLIKVTLDELSAVVLESILRYKGHNTQEISTIKNRYFSK